MKNEGPVLDRLTHRLSECPPDFLGEPRMGRRGLVHVDAVVNDLSLDLGGKPLDPQRLVSFAPEDKSRRNHLRLVLVGAWLLHDDWFREPATFAEAAVRWLDGGLKDLAAIVAADAVVSDPDRREELARMCLNALGFRPAGETVTQAEDRLRTLDSVARLRLVGETREKQERARQLREALRRKEAEEAAAKASRE